MKFAIKYFFMENLSYFWLGNFIFCAVLLAESRPVHAFELED